jgi:hypothetical protein
LNEVGNTGRLSTLYYIREIKMGNKWEFNQRGEIGKIVLVEAG